MKIIEIHQINRVRNLEEKRILLSQILNNVITESLKYTEEDISSYDRYLISNKQSIKIEFSDDEIEEEASVLSDSEQLQQKQ